RSKDRRKSRVIKSNIDNRKTDRRITKPLFLKCLRYNRVKKLVDKDQYYFFREIQSGNNHRIIRNGKELVNYASNNYLGLANHPAVIESSIKAIEKYGTGTTGARMLNGTMDLHNQLEEKLAKFKGGEDCMLCSSGYHTNVGVISALIAKNNHIIIDNKCHASIVDGCWLSGGKISIFKHNNLKDLESVLQGIDINSPKIIIVDGVYSMDGDLAKLDFIYKIGEKYKSVIMVDDAHAVGVIGKTGRGTSEHFDLQGKIDLMVGTLSKALGGIGGFVVASKKIIHYLKHNSRSFIFSASIPPANCAAALKALEIIEKDLTWHTKLWNNITYLKKALVISGFDIGNSASAIIPVIVKDEILTYKITGMLEKQGIYVNAIAYPAVRKRAARLRVSVMATHNQEDLDLFINKIRKLGRQFNTIEN
ncbi:MAG: pyridoxal phosphate-dependent aminotransferase family protein, partial [Spirochaetes bacterium]|nr:pyridoxal phosphate-dependent aminotransferase family protein [Spirochaetota bacterium]